MIFFDYFLVFCFEPEQCLVLLISINNDDNKNKNYEKVFKLGINITYGLEYI